MVVLIIAGIVLLVLGYMLPAPHPIPVVLQILGWIAFGVGLLLLVVGLFDGHIVTVAHQSMPVW